MYTQPFAVYMGKQCEACLIRGTDETELIMTRHYLGEDIDLCYLCNSVIAYYKQKQEEE